MKLEADIKLVTHCCNCPHFWVWDDNGYTNIGCNLLAFTCMQGYDPDPDWDTHETVHKDCPLRRGAHVLIVCLQSDVEQPVRAR